MEAVTEAGPGLQAQQKARKRILKWIVASLALGWLAIGCSALSIPRFQSLACEPLPGDGDHSVEECIILLQTSGTPVGTRTAAQAAYIGASGIFFGGPKLWWALRKLDLCMALPAGAIECGCEWADPTRVWTNGKERTLGCDGL